MGDSRPDRASAPEIELRQLSAERTGEGGFWKIGWRVKNRGPGRLRIQALRLPHGQFKSDENRFNPEIDLKPGAETQFQTLVRCDEPPGDVTENAFVIFYVLWLEERWRVFARIRVVVSSAGKPQATTESITTQTIGFLQKDLL